MKRVLVSCGACVVAIFVIGVAVESVGRKQWKDESEKYFRYHEDNPGRPRSTERWGRMIHRTPRSPGEIFGRIALPLGIPLGLLVAWLWHRRVAAISEDSAT